MCFMWLEYLPPFLAENLGVLSLILLGLLVEKQYISRPAIWANVAAINVHLYNQPLVGEFLVWYANIGLIVAVLGLYTYEFGESLPGWYYTMGWGYSSLPAAALVFLV